MKVLEAQNYSERQTIEGNNMARRKAEEALAICPENTWAFLILAGRHGFDYLFGTTKSPQESLEKAIELARKAVALDDGHPAGHSLLGLLYML